MRYSGVVSTISRLPSASPAYTAARSSGVDSPVMTALAIPKRSRLVRRWNTWSAMSARKGEMNRLGQRAEGGVGLEAQRLAASRGHDGEGGLPRPQPIENLSLGRMQRAVADDGLHNGRLQAVRIAPGRLLPLGAAGGQVGQRRLGRLVGGREVGFPFRLGEQIGGERHGVRVETGLQSAAAARRGHGFQHGLHRAAAAPFVDLHREGGVHHRVVHEQRVDGRAVEHDAGHARAPARGAPCAARSGRPVRLPGGSPESSDGGRPALRPRPGHPCSGSAGLPDFRTHQ